MKILVDEMPDRADKCQYSIFRENQKLDNGTTWWGCGWNHAQMVCPTPEKCPFFKAVEDNKNGNV